MLSHVLYLSEWGISESGEENLEMRSRQCYKIFRCYRLKCHTLMSYPWFQQVPSNPYPASPYPIPHKVWILDCKNCHMFLTNRAMKVSSFLQKKKIFVLLMHLSRQSYFYDQVSPFILRTRFRSTVRPITLIQMLYGLLQLAIPV